MADDVGDGEALGDELGDELADGLGDGVSCETSSADGQLLAVGDALGVGSTEEVGPGEKVGEGLAGGVGVGLDVDPVDGAMLGSLGSVGVVPERGETVADADGEESGVDAADGVADTVSVGSVGSTGDGDGEAPLDGEMLGEGVGLGDDEAVSSRLGEGKGAVDGSALMSFSRHGSGMSAGIPHGFGASLGAVSRAAGTDSCWVSSAACAGARGAHTNALAMSPTRAAFPSGRMQSRPDWVQTARIAPMSHCPQRRTPVLDGK